MKNSDFQSQDQKHPKCLSLLSEPFKSPKTSILCPLTGFLIAKRENRKRDICRECQAAAEKVKSTILVRMTSEILTSDSLYLPRNAGSFVLGGAYFSNEDLYDNRSTGGAFAEYTYKRVKLNAQVGQGKYTKLIAKSKAIHE